MKLYELKNEFEELYNLIDSEEFDEQMILDTLEGVQGELKDKAISIACIIKQLEYDASALKAEEEKMEKRRKSIEKKRDFFKDYLSENLQKVGLLKIDSPQAVISFRPSKAVEIEDESAFRDWATGKDWDYLTFAEPKINKATVKKAIEAGEEIPFAKIVERKNIGVK